MILLQFCQIMARFAGWGKLKVGIPDSMTLFADFVRYSTARREMDTEIRHLAEHLKQGDPEGNSGLFSGALRTDVHKPE